MQQPDEEPLHTEKISSIILQYPTIPVYGTPASWLSQSQLVTMASNPDDSSCDDTLSSLGDSTYDFVDDKSVVVSDDEDQSNSNQSISSNDGPEIESPNTHPQPSGFINDRPSCSHSFSMSFNPEDSLTTESQSTYGDAIRNRDGSTAEACGDVFVDQTQDREQNLEFQESNDSAGYIKGSYLMRVFEGSGVSEVLHHTHPTASPSPVVATARQSMSSSGLIPNKIFKVLYVGEPSAKDPIIQKIGSALAATLRSERVRPSRFNVVPISSFGDSMPPEVVLIDSAGLELGVDECVSASFAKRDGGNDTVSMTLSDRTLVESSWSGSKFTVTNQWKLPDIAIFYFSESDNISAKQIRRYAQSFMTRHRVPCIFISQTPLWDKPTENIALDSHTPHICLEAYGSDAKKLEILDRLPVDIRTFMSLDPRQMNRNLACLTTLYNATRVSVHCSSVMSELEENSGVRCKSHMSLASFPYFSEPQILKDFPFVRKFFASGLIFLIGFLLYQFAIATVYNIPGFSVLQPHTAGTDMTHSLMLTRPTNAAPVSQTARSSALTISTSPATRQKPVLKSDLALQTNSGIASFLSDGHAIVRNRSEQFQVNVIGDSLIVLRPPHRFTRLRRASKLFFSVLRGNSLISHEVSTLFDGVFVIKIAPENAFGVLNVSVWTNSRPKINESFNVNFGTPWFRFGRWKKTEVTVTKFLNKELVLVDTGLISLYNHTNAALRLLIDETLEKAGKFRNEAAKIGMTSLQQTTKSKDIVLAQTIGISRSISRSFRYRSLVASRQLVLYVDQLRKHLTLYTTQKSVMASRRVQQISRVAFNVDIKAFADDALKYRDRHIRVTQKKALKLWWKMRGVPKTKSGVSGKSDTRIPQSKKRTSR